MGESVPQHVELPRHWPVLSGKVTALASLRLVVLVRRCGRVLLLVQG